MLSLLTMINDRKELFIMKKVITMLMALTLVGGAFTGCSDEKEQSSENSKEKSSVTDSLKSDEDSDDEDDKPVDDDFVDAEKVDKYSTGYGLTLCDEESIVPIQGSIVDIAMGYDVLCLTKDEKVVSFEEDMISADAPGGVRFVDDTVGYGAIVERADGTCICFEDAYQKINKLCEDFIMPDGSYYESSNGMQYIVNDGEKLVGYNYNYKMELTASEIPVIIDPYDMSGDENTVTAAGDWFSPDYSTFLLLDTNNQVWKPWSSVGVMQMDYDEDDNRIEIETFNDPVITDCSMLCYSPRYNEIIIAKASDTANLYLLTDEDEGYAESMTIALPDGLKTTDIKEFVRNCDDGFFITNSNEMYSISANAVVVQPELSQLMQEGKIVEIVGDGSDTLFLMDDGCVYEK